MIYREQLEVPIIQATYNLALVLQKSTATFPVHFRNQLGADIAQIARLLFKLVVRSNQTRDFRKRKAQIDDVLVELLQLRFYLRMAKDLKIISQPKFQNLHEDMHDLNRQLCGLRKWVETKISQP